MLAFVRWILHLFFFVCQLFIFFLLPATIPTTDVKARFLNQCGHKAFSLAVLAWNAGQRSEQASIVPLVCMLLLVLSMCAAYDNIMKEKKLPPISSFLSFFFYSFSSFSVNLGTLTKGFSIFFFLPFPFPFPMWGRKDPSVMEKLHPYPSLLPPSVRLQAILLSRLYQLSSEKLSEPDPFFPAPLAIPDS